MRIFFVTNNYTPYSGGVTQSIIAITNALREQGHEVFIITLNFLGKEDRSETNVIRITCPIKFMYKKNYMAIPWRPTHAIQQLIEQYKPDIIHVHHPFLLGVSALHAARRYNIPCVFTYHTIYEDYAHYVPLPRPFTKKVIHTMVKHFCNKVDSIVAPSNAIKEYLIKENIQKPITVIPSPLRDLFITQHKEKKLEPHTNPFNILVVSRFVPEKNIPFIFEVFKQLPGNFNLTLVGYGNQYNAMQNLAFNTLKLSSERVRFIYKPTEDELLNQYRNADLFLFSSQTDTQGIVLAESMSQGVPVVAIDGPGQRDIIVNGVNGFIINNAQEAATRITQIAQDTTLHNKLITGAYATAQHYHADTIIQKLVAFYHTIIT